MRDEPLADSIAIFDRDEKRSKEIAKAFLANGCRVTALSKQLKDGEDKITASFFTASLSDLITVHYILKDGHLIETDSGKETDYPVQVPAACLAILRHAREDEKWPRIQAKAVIYYSGDDPRTDSRIPDRAKYIGRPISWEWGAPSLEEAGELLDYLRQLSTNQAVQTPSLLQPLTPPQYLISVAVLCQGYLFLHGLGGTPGPDLFTPEQRRNSAISHLSERSYRNFLPTDLPTKLEAVKRSGWWRRAFSDDFSSGQARGRQDFLKKVKAEWDRVTRNNTTKRRAGLTGAWDAAWEHVKALSECLDRDEDIQPAVVAKAYCSLVDALGTGEAERSARTLAETAH